MGGPPLGVPDAPAEPVPVPVADDPEAANSVPGAGSNRGNVCGGVENGDRPNPEFAGLAADRPADAPALPACEPSLMVPPAADSSRSPGRIGTAPGRLFDLN